MAQLVKNLLTMQGTRVWSLGWKDDLAKGMATHSSILGWTVPWAEEPDRLQSMESHRGVSLPFISLKKKKIKGGGGNVENYSIKYDCNLSGLVEWIFKINFFIDIWLTYNIRLFLIWGLKPSEEPSHGRQPIPFEFYLWELDQVLTVNVGEKFPHVSGRGRGRGAILKNTRAVCTSFTMLPSEEISLSYPNLLECYWSLMVLEEGKYPLQSALVDGKY